MCDSPGWFLHHPRTIHPDSVGRCLAVASLGRNRTRPLLFQYSSQLIVVTFTVCGPTCAETSVTRHYRGHYIAAFFYGLVHKFLLQACVCYIRTVEAISIGFTLSSSQRFSHHICFLSVIALKEQTTMDYRDYFKQFFPYKYKYILCFIHTV